MRLRRTGCTVVGLLGLLLLPVLAVDAQSLSTADLSGDWSVTYVSTPTTAFTAASVRAYQGTVTFSAAGAASGQVIADVFTAGALTFTVSGSLGLSGQGAATGTLTLTGLDTRSLTIREARILANGHTMVGAATLQRPGGIRETGLITFARLVSDQTFTRLQDLVATWNYHELTPSNPGLNGGDADWTRGKILFHPGGCSAAELFFANGTVREPLGDPTAATFG